jgi:hypothetical protein
VDLDVGGLLTAEALGVDRHLVGAGQEGCESIDPGSIRGGGLADTGLHFKRSDLCTGDDSTGCIGHGAGEGSIKRLSGGRCRAEKTGQQYKPEQTSAGIERPGDESMRRPLHHPNLRKVKRLSAPQINTGSFAVGPQSMHTALAFTTAPSKGSSEQGDANPV